MLAGSIREMQIVENLHLCPLGVTKSLGVVGALPFYGDLERGLGHLYGSSTSEAQREAMFGGGL